jgi:hypothetical protein
VVSILQLELLKMDPTFLNRNVNQGFSGGEKKRNEILQLAVLDVSLKYALTTVVAVAAVAALLDGQLPTCSCSWTCPSWVGSQGCVRTSAAAAAGSSGSSGSGGAAALMSR